MHLIHSGIAALYKRLDMIERAQKDIELEYFIFSSKKKAPKSTENGDERSSKFILNKLIDKALAKVSVRILVDHSLAVFQFDENHVAAIHREIKKRGGNSRFFQVRYYNSVDSQFRSHRKLISIDDTEAITGGRNIEDKYFDLDHSYNFVDRDIWVKGPVVPIMRYSFDAFWFAGVTVKADVDSLLANAPEKEELVVNQFLHMTAADKDLLSKVMSIGKSAYETSQTHACPKTTFASEFSVSARFFLEWILLCLFI